MRKLSVCAASLLALLAFGACCSDAANQKMIGVLFANPNDAGTDKETQARVLRDGVEVDAEPGFPVFAGDTVITGKEGDISVGFLDSSAIRILASSRLELTSFGDPLKQEDSHFALSEGHASMSVSQQSKIFLDVGDMKNALVADGRDSARWAIIDDVPTGIFAKAASKGTKFDILVNIVNGAYVTTVGVTSGSVTLTPAGNQTQIVVGTVVVATLNMTAILTNPIDKATLAGLEATAVSDIDVSVSSKNITMKTIQKNADGSTSTGQVTLTPDGTIVTADKWTTKGSDGKTVATWSQSSKGVSMSQVFNGGVYTLKGKFSAAGSGTGTVKGTDKTGYKGTMVYDPNTGVYTFTSTTADKKTGTNVVLKYVPNGTGYTTTAIVIPKTGSATETTTTIDPVSGNKVVTTVTGTYIGGVFTPTGTPVVTTTPLTGGINGKGPPPIYTGKGAPGNTIITQNEPPVSK